MRNMFDPFKHPIQVIRQKAVKMSDKVRLPKDAVIKRITIDGIKAEWLRTSNVDDGAKKVVLYFHSGGFCLGYGNNHRDFALNISRISNVKILAIDYRLAPENKYPAANDDCLKAYMWLLEQGYNSKDIIIGGDSSGAGLALMTLLSVRDSVLPLPVAAFFVSLMGGDLRDFDGESFESRRENDPLNTKEVIRKYGELYLGSAILEPPVKQTLKGLPDMLIQVGGDEVLLSDSVELAKNAEAEGVRVTLEVWEGMWHVFQGFSMIVPEAKAATNNIGRFIGKYLAE